MLNILVVDDDDAVRAILVRTLTRDGHNVIEAQHAADAIRSAAAHEGRIDLLISDVYMPGLRGPELVEVLRTAMPHVRVLHLSGYDKQDVRRSGVRAGDFFLSKPFTPAQLRDAVAAAMEGPSEPKSSVPKITPDL